MLYGTKRDKDDIAARLDEMAESFPARWALASSTSLARPVASGQGLGSSSASGPGLSASSASGPGLGGSGGSSQEVTFIRALALLLRSGLTAAAAATTFVGEPVVYAEGDQASSYFLQSPQRLPVTLSEYSATTARNLENNSENTNATSTGVGGTKPGMRMEVIEPPLRLYDTYQNAFQRVIDSCFREISVRGGLIPPNANDELLMAFVAWEQVIHIHTHTSM